jgi:hypothetical protein
MRVQENLIYAVLAFDAVCMLALAFAVLRCKKSKQ